MPSTYAVRDYLVACADSVTRLLALSVNRNFWFCVRDAESLLYFSQNPYT